MDVVLTTNKYTIDVSTTPPEPLVDVQAPQPPSFDVQMLSRQPTEIDEQIDTGQPPAVDVLPPPKHVIDINQLLGGPPGPTGPAGPAGGPTGPAGPAGPSGPAGPMGPQGLQGLAGPQGADGPQGVQGVQGVPGPVGAKGDVGAPGTPGLTGPQGNQGIQGPAGVAGPPGAQGVQGDPGPAGATGPAGPTGPPGTGGGGGASVTVADTAPTGAHQGDLWYDSTVAELYVRFADPTSAQWVVANNKVGPQGNDSTVPGPIGPPGLTGPQGATGAQGNAGPQGPIGPQGITGTPGAAGAVGATGSVGPTGPQGVQGIQGIQGDQGPQGLIAEAPADGKVYGRQGSTATWLAALPLTGGTVTGAISIAPASGGASLGLNKPASGQASAIWSYLAGSARWGVQLGNSVAESSGNVGSNFEIDRYSDAGAFIDAPLTIIRSTGAVNIGSSTGDVITTLNAASTSYNARFRLNSAKQWEVNAGSGGGFNITDNTDGVTALNFNNTAGILYLPMTCNSTLTVVGDATLSAGVAMGSTIAASATDLSKHLALWGTTYGACVTGSTLNLVANGAATLALTSTGGTVAGTFVSTGNMTCSGNFNTNQVTGTVGVFSGNIQCNVASNQNALIYMQGPRSWYIGSMTNSQFYITDNTAGAVRVAILSDGTFNIQNNAGIAGGTLNLSGPSGVFYMTSNGVRQWRLLANSDGQFYLTDMSSGPHAFYVQAGNGYVIFPNGFTSSNVATFSSNIQVNGQITVVSVVDIQHSYGIGYQQQGTGSRKAFTSTGTQLTHYINGAASGSWNFNTPCDERVKESVGEPEGDALDDLLRVRLVSFDETMMRDPRFQPTHNQWGFSAQKMQAAIPEAVNIVEIYDKDVPDPREVLTIDIMPLLARCIGAIQQLKAGNDELRAELAALKRTIH